MPRIQLSLLSTTGDVQLFLITCSSISNGKCRVKCYILGIMSMLGFNVVLFFYYYYSFKLYICFKHLSRCNSTKVTKECFSFQKLRFGDVQNDLVSKMDTWGEDLGGSSPAVPIGPDQNIKCDRYYTTKNGSHHFIYGGYEGIPENLLINVIVWLVSVMTSLLSQHYWN